MLNADSRQIVFDWNGTLFDDTPPVLDAVNKMFTHHGYEAIDLATFQTNYEIPWQKHFSKYDLSSEAIERIAQSADDLFHDHYEPKAATALLREGAEELLTFARANAIRNLILSNHLVDKIREQLQRLAIETYFVEVLAYASRATQFRDITKGERLRGYMAERKMNPKNTMIVGDSTEEIHIAKEQGFVSVAITGGCVSEKRLRAERPDHLIHSLHALKTILQERGFAP